MWDGPQDVIEAGIRSAFVGYPKDDDRDGRMYWRSLKLPRARIGKLAPHEREVFHLVIRGQTNKQMANTLGGTARTIEAHRRRVMEKMQIQSLAELVSLAERIGILRGTSGSRQMA